MELELHGREPTIQQYLTVKQKVLADVEVAGQFLTGVIFERDGWEGGLRASVEVTNIERDDEIFFDGVVAGTTNLRY